MKKIIVAGAGHGGLASAFILANNGYDVTVYEKAKRQELGHDWHGLISLDAFDYCGIKRPSEYSKPQNGILYLFGRKLLVPIPAKNKLVSIDRRYLSKYLVEQCEVVGVKFEFGRSCFAPLLDGNKVVGIKTSYVAQDGNDARQVERRVEDVYADLVIDAAGMYSSIRTNLPDDFGIKKNFSSEEIYYTYRAYYEKTYKKSHVLVDNNVYINHAGLPGISRAIRREDSIDCQVGSFVPFDEYKLRDAMNGFQKHHNNIGTRLIRGGFRGNIPLTFASSAFCGNGYAAVGDSVAMTEPLSGHGITLSMKAGKLLADAIIKVGDNELNERTLWEYQYNYFNEFENKSLIEFEMKKLVPVKQWFELPNEIKACALNVQKAMTVARLLPREYDVTKVAQWKREYETL